MTHSLPVRSFLWNSNKIVLELQKKEIKLKIELPYDLAILILGSFPAPLDSGGVICFMQYCSQQTELDNMRLSACPLWNVTKHGFFFRWIICLKGEWSPSICKSVDKAGGHYVNGHKPDPCHSGWEIWMNTQIKTPKEKDVGQRLQSFFKEINSADLLPNMLTIIDNNSLLKWIAKIHVWRR